MPDDDHFRAVNAAIHQTKHRTAHPRPLRSAPQHPPPPENVGIRLPNHNPIGGWLHHAACADADPTLFDDDPVDELELTVAEAAKRAAAMAYCRSCPVRVPCAREGFRLDASNRFGRGNRLVWGGLATVTRRDRAAPTPASKPSPPPVATPDPVRSVWTIDEALESGVEAQVGDRLIREEVDRLPVGAQVRWNRDSHVRTRYSAARDGWSPPVPFTKRQRVWIVVSCG